MNVSIELSWGIYVAYQYIREAVTKRELRALTEGAIVEGNTIPMLYAICYGMARILGA